mmetsp:Transcript_2870/g.11843  ORF Transcript_2870/g.11843 Transcript_2870/m.11843 type:complete len:246 (+) Transcript_2870:602-1339(+)
MLSWSPSEVQREPGLEALDASFAPAAPRRAAKDRRSFSLRSASFSLRAFSRAFESLASLPLPSFVTLWFFRTAPPIPSFSSSSVSYSNSSSLCSSGFLMCGLEGCCLKCCAKRSLFVRRSCGPTVSSLNRFNTALMSPLLYWNSLLLLLKITSAIWQSHSTESSIAFFIKPFLRFVNVTCRLRSSAMRSIRIFLRPMAVDLTGDPLGPRGLALAPLGGLAMERTSGWCAGGVSRVRSFTETTPMP